VSRSVIKGDDDGVDDNEGKVEEGGGDDHSEHTRNEGRERTQHNERSHS
jgi:hypothetical protein